jgi:hypothetical protein
MRRLIRRWFLIAIPLAVVLALGLWLSWVWTQHVTKANFDRIELGMPLPQVVGLMGGSPAFEALAAIGGDYDRYYWDEDPDGLVPTNMIRLHLHDGKVTSKDFQPWTFADWWQHLRRRLGL